MNSTWPQPQGHPQSTLVLLCQHSLYSIKLVLLRQHSLYSVNTRWTPSNFVILRQHSLYSVNTCCTPSTIVVLCQHLSSDGLALLLHIDKSHCYHHCEICFRYSCLANDLWSAFKSLECICNGKGRVIVEFAGYRRSSPICITSTLD